MAVGEPSATPTEMPAGEHGMEQRAAAAPGGDESPTPAAIDLAGIEADLDGVQAALTRLADGTYWTDEVTGEPIPTEVLAADPLARRA